MTNKMQTCSNFLWAWVFFMNTRPDEMQSCMHRMPGPPRHIGMFQSHQNCTIVGPQPNFVRHVGFQWKGHNPPCGRIVSRVMKNRPKKEGVARIAKESNPETMRTRNFCEKSPKIGGGQAMSQSTWIYNRGGRMGRRTSTSRPSSPRTAAPS